jgi:hypothetical protein
MSSGITAHGAKLPMASADGTRIALFSNDPFATAHTTGSSRSGLRSVTCCALSARSSPSTPAVFFAATFVNADTSSSTVAMSSSNTNKLEGISYRIPPRTAFATSDETPRSLRTRSWVLRSSEARSSSRRRSISRRRPRAARLGAAAATAPGGMHIAADKDPVNEDR